MTRKICTLDQFYGIFKELYTQSSINLITGAALSSHENVHDESAIHIHQNIWINTMKIFKPSNLLFVKSIY